ncbi:hypothetical protein [Pseudovibrio sp. Ad26]|uniref:hypothetical protein n=1 Tax=Pseudovibrio sp. Ad26 TaxID=989410 RepID=UPI0007AEAF96|nr:hypothetical protein [Pseudovibrio sp. Ad26]KZL13382.1 hypothetical protein PsAD26_02152 [Pseudovibrio sp. Ad26]
MALDSSVSSNSSLRNVLPALLLAGVIGEVAFEAYAWFVSPILFGPVLEPAYLIRALATKLFGLTIPYSVAFIVHFSVGAVVFPLAVFAVYEVTRLRLWLSGVVAGVLLWYIAQGMLAPFIGRSFMMDFGAYTQSSFIGHVGMAMVMGVIFQKFSENRRER